MLIFEEIIKMILIIKYGRCTQDLLSSNTKGKKKIILYIFKNSVVTLL